MTASPTRCCGSGTSTTARGWRWPPASRRSTRSCWRAPTRRATTASSTSAASVRATRPTCSASTSSASWRPARVWQAGRLVAEGGEVVSGAVPSAPVPALMRDTVTLGEPPAAGRLALTHSDGTRVRAVGVESRSLTTLRRELTLGEPGADVAHAAVVERHRGTGRIGLGYATGFGLRRGRDGVDGGARRPQLRDGRRASRGRPGRHGRGRGAAGGAGRRAGGRARRARSWARCRCRWPG